MAEQLGRLQPAIGAQGHDIRERAAAIDPELPPRHDYVVTVGGAPVKGAG
jgi:hypothetical protein